jgi:N-terminal acetyltransferase B complex catalytic subunit
MLLDSTAYYGSVQCGLTLLAGFPLPLFAAVAESPHGALMGYVLGKAEGDGPLWHGHVSALTVAPAYRRLGLAKTLMEKFEDACVHTYNAYFVDLFVRSSNTLAIRMYEKFGYSTYRRVLGYYSGELPEDALDMRKALPRYIQCSILSASGTASPGIDT